MRWPGRGGLCGRVCFELSGRLCVPVAGIWRWIQQPVCHPGSQTQMWGGWQTGMKEEKAKSEQPGERPSSWGQSLDKDSPSSSSRRFLQRGS